MEKTRGRLSIFFGWSEYDNKTEAMNRAAYTALKHGASVYFAVEEELDIAAVSATSPSLVVLEGLARDNPVGHRHARRYQDVEELLLSGIDVYATLNVQNIESLNDVVATMTGEVVAERVPDYVFDNADYVELSDYESDGTETENETMLRELAQRRYNDRRVHRGETQAENMHTGEHILVCLSSAPSNAKIIRTAARMAYAFRGTFTALYVETPDFSAMTEVDKTRLSANMRLATQLGARIETLCGDDVPLSIAEFARLSGVTKIVIGRSAASRRRLFQKPNLTERLISAAPNLDVHIIPDAGSPIMQYRAKKSRTSSKIRQSLLDMLKSLGILLCASVLGSIFERLGFRDVNIITIYILGVLITSIVTTKRSYSLISSALSVSVYNFLFTEPKYTLLAYDNAYPLTFLIMFCSSLITGSLAEKLKNNAKASAQAAFRVTVLFDTNQLLAQARGRNEIAEVTANQLIKLLGSDLVVYLSEDGELGEPQILMADGGAIDYSYTSEAERECARWVLLNNKQAGATTDTMGNVRCLYLTLRVNQSVYGVVGIPADENSPDSFERSIILSILGESALAMENEKNAREAEEAAIMAKNEQLRANLLRSISHDLRTPLTSISGNASNLMNNGESFDEVTKTRLYTDIYDDSMWLINLVENLLSVTRLEGGRMNLHLSAELVDDVISEAMNHISRERTKHIIRVVSEDELMLAQMDAKLIVQVLINIIDNAIKYTQEGSEIVIRSRREAEFAVISVSDNGEGISDEMKPKVFDMFFTGGNKLADSRRSLGLGLSLCRSIVNAHGGAITVSDNLPHGTIFTFTLPIKEAHLHE